MKMRSSLLLIVSLFFLASCQMEPLESTMEQTSLQAKVGQGKGLVLICHYDSDLDEYKEIEVAPSAVDAHLNHGDIVGGCNTNNSTFVPDDAFEKFLIDEGFDDVLDDYVPTENISSIENLLINGNQYPIEDLTGIEDFSGLKNRRI